MTTLLPQDVASFRQEENNDLHSIFEGTHGASIGRDDGNGTSHLKHNFLYFGVDNIKYCQRLNKYWLDRAMQAKILAAQARQHLQRVKEYHNQIDDARKQRESCIRSLFLSREEEASIDLDGTINNIEGQDYFLEFT